MCSAKVIGCGITISEEISDWLANYDNTTAYIEMVV